MSQKKITCITNESREPLLKVRYDVTKTDNNKNKHVLSNFVSKKLDAVIKTTDFIAENIKNQNQYTIYFPKGIGELQESKKHPGFYYGDIIDTKTKKYVNKALLKKIPESSQIINSVTSVAAIATQQYYLESIDKKLTTISQTVESIKNFLEIDKKSKIESYIHYIKNIHKTIAAIEEDKILKQTVLVELQRIQTEIYSNILFYKGQINENSNLETNEKANKIKKQIKEVANYIELYKCSITLYIYCRTIEIMINKTSNENYINNMIEDFEDILKDHNEDFEKWRQMYNEYLNKASAYKENFLLKLIEDLGHEIKFLGFHPRNIAVVAGAKIAGSIAGKFNNKLQINKDKQKQEIQIIVSDSLEKDKNIFDNMLVEISNYIKIRTCPFQISYDDGQTYIAYEDNKYNEKIKE